MSITESDADFYIRAAYLALLGREPKNNRRDDQRALLLRTGDPLDLIAAIAASEEYRRRSIGDTGLAARILRSEHAPTGFVRRTLHPFRRMLQGRLAMQRRVALLSAWMSHLSQNPAVGQAALSSVQHAIDRLAKDQLALAWRLLSIEQDLAVRGVKDAGRVPDPPAAPTPQRLKGGARAEAAGDPNTSFVEDFRAEYNPNIQLSPFQAQAIGMAIDSRGPSCRVLVFGVGHDSGLWLRLNKTGRTLFLESDPEWAAEAHSTHPAISVSRLETFSLTVAKSMSLSSADLASYPPPEEVTRTPWDVILVDGPPGQSPDEPGRALPIYWAAKYSKPHTHVFVDDYDRPLERALSDRYLRPRNLSSTVIFARESNSERQLFWSMGDPS